MTCTEEEAKRKWCPYTAPQGQGVPCIASGCMAWRWEYKPDPEAKPRASGFPMPPKCVRSENGYCGLAGAP